MNLFCVPKKKTCGLTHPKTLPCASPSHLVLHSELGYLPPHLTHWKRCECWVGPQISQKECILYYKISGIFFLGSSHILEYSQQTFLANIKSKQRCCCVIRGFDRWDAGESRNKGRHHAGQLIFPTTAMPASKLLVVSRGVRFRDYTIWQEIDGY